MFNRCKHKWKVVEQASVEPRTGNFKVRGHLDPAQQEITWHYIVRGYNAA